MKDIIWFCRTNDSSSLSRITDSVVPLLSLKFNVTLLSNKTNLKCVKHVEMGADTEYIKYNEFLKTIPGSNDEENIRCVNMKYILVQMVNLIYDGNYEYIVICNGVYEIDWLTKILTSDPQYLINRNLQKTKLIVWSPIDYIPSNPVIKNIINADIVLTMTPVMMEIIKKNCKTCNKIDWVGHGSDIEIYTKLTRKNLVSKLNKMRKEKRISSKTEFKTSDIIILNANNYGPLDKSIDSVENTPGTRKRLDITVKAFLKIIENNKNAGINNVGIKLWIHTNLKSFFRMLEIEKISLSSFADNIILSNNKVTNSELSWIYQMSNISIQTSTGEGWSLTNLEASMYNSLQVVPDFLACGYHFKNRGILIPVSEKTIKNEGNVDVIIGEVSIDDTVSKLNEALELLKNKDELNELLKKAHDYAKQYTWSSVVDKIESILL